ncbi:MAG TPA: hypothetical protein VLD86_00430 [Ilumatobacteraceae bacterium]|nr:hypothetical protein [Ilumatobacteraceae bacterium]
MTEQRKTTKPRRENPDGEHAAQQEDDVRRTGDDRDDTGDGRRHKSREMRRADIANGERP